MSKRVSAFETRINVQLKPQDQAMINQVLRDFEKNVKKYCSALSLKVPDHFEVSILLCGSYKIKRLNQSFRNRNQTTDVLSFPNHENLRHLNKAQLNGDSFLGDLAICWPVLIRQAKEFNITPREEFIHLLVHGFLHLLGYDHEVSEKEEKLMEKKEENLILKFSRAKKNP